jgi:cytochrome c5
MSEHHPESEADSSGPNAVKLAIAVFVGAIGLIVLIMLLAQYAIGGRKLGTGNDRANSPEAIAARIAPAATFVVDASKGAVPVATGIAAAAPTATADSAKPAVAAAIVPAAIPAAGAPAAKGGEGVYKTACAACHSAGVAGAPKSGDKAAWAPRLAQGKDTLYKHAIAGFQGKAGVMPAKGGNPTLSDTDVKAAVDYMMALNK